MKDGLRQTMAFLHGWAGLIPGWLLYAVFLTGTLSYYRQEITQWMRPELSGTVADPRAAEHALAWLARKGRDARLWRIDLPTDRNPVTEAMWQGAAGGFRSQELDPRSGKALQARETMGGDFLYYFHFDLNAPGRLGRWLVCFATVVMLVAIISGVITHRRIFADFFTFRSGKGQRSWLDAHNLVGVAALPYHMMISFTGLVTLTTMFLPWAVERAYSGDMGRYAQELDGSAGEAALPAPGTAVTVDRILAQTRTLWDGGTPGRILIDRANPDRVTVTIERRDSEAISYDRRWLRFAHDGSLIARHDESGPAVTTRGWLYGLHLARFSNAGLRFLFFCSGLLGTAMIATGLILWVVKRRPREPAEPRVAERLNVAVIAGLPLAIAAYLLSNRLLPAELPGRAMWEAAAFFAAWFGALIHALLAAPARAWRGQLTAMAIVCLMAPACLAFSRAGLFAWIAGGDVSRLTIDLALVAVGATVLTLLATSARKASKS